MHIGLNKVWFLGSFPIVIPPQGYRCVAWNLLMLVVFVVFVSVVPLSMQATPAWPVFLVLVALNVILSCRTTFTDPGYIPAVLRDEEDDGSGLQQPNPLVEAADPSYTSDLFSLMFCRTCRHLRPKFSSHCKMCDACVSHFDHHCIVLGCCVGERNVGAFISYLFSVAASAAYGTGILLFSLKDMQDDLVITNIRLYLVIAMFVCGGVSAVCVGGFAVYYSFLVLSGKTSKQFLVGSSSGEGSFGVWSLVRSLFAPAPSLLPAYRDWQTQSNAKLGQS